MDFNLWTFIIDNIKAAGVIGGYVSISIIGLALITFALRGKIQAIAQIKYKWAQPLIGAFLGVIPGCGGTIIASSMYKNHQLSFGGLFATFITTLGEGSFVLLGASDEADVAANLTAFAVVNIVGFVTGLVLGLIIDLSGFIVRTDTVQEKVAHQQEHSADNNPIARSFIENIGFYLIIAIAIFLAPGSIMALWGGGIDAIADLTVWVTIAFTIISIVYYFVYRYILKEDCHCEHDDEDIKSTLLDSVVDITMVISYVFVGLLIANFAIDVLIGTDRFAAWMKASSFIVVIIAACIGATPGCGGMIAVAVAFIAIDNFPMAALIAASISTSGDGIFPLLAQNKKDAIIITVCGFVVALVVGGIALVLGV